MSFGNQRPETEEKKTFPRVLPEYDFVLGQEMLQAIQQALGFASVSWEPFDCTGVFESQRVTQVADELMEIAVQFAKAFPRDSNLPIPVAQPQRPEMKVFSSAERVRIRENAEYHFGEHFERDLVQQAVDTIEEAEEVRKTGEDTDFQHIARTAVCDYYNSHVEKTDEFKIGTGDVYIVWFCKTLQNWKALVSTTVSDGMYYEVTYNGDKNEIYLDAYKKFHNVRLKERMTEEYGLKFVPEV